jgi:aminopeptidase N
VRSGSRTTWTYEQAEPMATYLATVQIGRYVEEPLDGSDVRQRFLAPAALVAQVRADLARQPRMVETFTRLFGPYPFGSYTVVVTADDLEIPLEAQTVSVFGANHLDGTGSLERLVAHELAHQWFGNSLTVARWSDIWLHEGFACYAEWLWSEASGGDDAATLARRHRARLEQAPQDLVLSDPGPDLMFDDRVYKRGALVLHELRRRLGDDEFFAAVRDWVSQNRFGTVTTTGFVDHVVARGASREDLDLWLHGTALPAP